MTEKESLQKAVQVGNALRSLRASNGYVEFVDILRSLYKENLMKIIDKEDLTARVTLNVLQDIISKIDDKINFSVDAAEDLKSSKFKPMEI